MKIVGRLLAGVFALALLLAVGLSTYDRAQAQSTITVAQGFLCSGGPGCTLLTGAGGAAPDFTTVLSGGNIATADNVLTIVAPPGSTPTSVTVKVGGTTKIYGDADGDSVQDPNEVTTSAPSFPFQVAFVEKPVPATDIYALQAFSGNSISIDFTAADKAPFQAAKAVTVDNFAPSIIVESPSNPFVTKTGQGASVTFSATITDSLASFADTAATSGPSSRLQYSDQNSTLAETAGGRIDLIVGDVTSAATASTGAKAPLRTSHLEKVDGGWRVTWTVGAAGLKTFIGGAAAEAGKVPWHIEAVDRAGNIARSTGNLSSKSTAVGATGGTSAVVDGFAGGGYSNDVFNGRMAKVTAAAPAAATATGFTAPSPVTECVAETVAITNPSATFTPPAGGVVWMTDPIDDTAVISDFAVDNAGVGTFTFSAAIEVTARATGTIDHDLDTGNDEVACTVTATSAVQVPVGATIQVLNTQSVIVDDEVPTLEGKFTGYAWNGSKAKGSRLVMGASAKRNSIMLEIKDTSGLDVSTVTPASFAVGGNTVTSVLVIDTLQEDPSDKRAANSVGNILVFLTLGTNLETSATPLVSIPVGVITDNAGNALNTAATPDKAVDGIGPTLTLSTDADISNKAITVTIESDEDLGAPPELWTTLVPMNSTMVTADDPAAKRSTSPSGSLQRWTAKHTASSSSSGRYNVYATGEDTVGTGNPSKIGHQTDSANAAAFTYQLDTKLNSGVQPTVTIGDVTAGGSLKGDPDDAVAAATGDVELIDPLVLSVDFAREGSEYSRDSYKTVTLTAASLVVRAADGTMLDERDFNIATDVNSLDNIKFTISLLNPRVGNYTLTAKAMDTAGNDNLNNTSATSAESLTFTWKVIAPKPVPIALTPGWNLISLPFQPGNPAINSVVPADHPVDIVMTFDNAEKVWLISRRDADTGLFTGDLGVMTASTAYFVRTSNFEALELLRPSLATQAAAPAQPPAIRVVEGWNLVPVVTNTPGVTAISADGYFGTLATGTNAGWLKALTFDTLSRVWTSVSPGDTVILGVGGINPCTGKAVDADKVKARTEPCQIGPYTENSSRTDDTAAVQADPTANPPVLAADATGGRDGYVGTFDVDDTVTIGMPVFVGKGYWLYATGDGTLIPS